MRGNTVGSLSVLHQLVTDQESAYILGLWCADGYYWSSSIGITSVDKRFVKRFRIFFRRYLPEERLKLRVYYPLGEKPEETFVPSYTMRLAKQVAYQFYVNSRPLLRLFQGAEREVSALPIEYVPAYFAGRFDGDGSVDKNLRNDVRIVYSNAAEAWEDKNLLDRLRRYRTRVYEYKSAKTHVLYISRMNARQFLQDISPYSIKMRSLLPRRDSSATQMDGEM